MNEKISLFVVSHKKLKQENYPERKIIYVGKNSEDYVDSASFTDSIGDNIADKNYTYCECSAIYRIWKNYHEAPYIGIEHYRRLFCNIFKKPRTTSYFLKKLKKYDFIVMYNRFYFVRNDRWFKRNHGKEMYYALRNNLAKVEPEYLSAFDEVMKRRHLSACNMFVTSKENYDAYCSFLFKVLFEVEKNIEIPKDLYQRRIMGFMAERLLDVYILKNGLRKKQSLVLMNRRYER